MYKNEAAFVLVRMLAVTLQGSARTAAGVRTLLLPEQPTPCSAHCRVHCRASSMLVLLVSHPGLDLLSKFWHWLQHVLCQRLTIEGIRGGVQQVPQDDGPVHDGS